MLRFPYDPCAVWLPDTSSNQRRIIPREACDSQGTIIQINAFLHSHADCSDVWVLENLVPVRTPRFFSSKLYRSHPQGQLLSIEHRAGQKAVSDLTLRVKHNGAQTACN